MLIPLKQRTQAQLSGELAYLGGFWTNIALTHNPDGIQGDFLKVKFQKTSKFSNKDSLYVENEYCHILILVENKYYYILMWIEN